MLMPCTNNSSYKTDCYGRIIGYGLHDSYLVGFYFDEDRVSIKIRNSQSTLIRIELFGVKEIGLVELCKNAIVSDIYFWEAAHAPKAWGVPDSAWNTVFYGRMSLDDIKREVENLAKTMPQLYLFHTECSYGGAIAVVCKDMKIFIE